MLGFFSYGICLPALRDDLYGSRQKLICIFWLVIPRPQANETDAKDDIIKKADIELHWKCQQMQSGMQCCCILGQINDAVFELGCSFNSMSFKKSFAQQTFPNIQNW